MLQRQRWVSEKSRITWEAMSRQEHAQIVRAAKKGRAPDDVGTALLALHWAWAVIGPPTARNKYNWWAVFTDVRPKAAFADSYDGRAENDVRTYVRKDARRVEQACLDRLQELGADIGLPPH